MTFRILMNELYLLTHRIVRAILFGLIPLREFQELSDISERSYCTYLRAEATFWFKTPRILRNVRKYFKKKKKGFGEDAFFGLWFLLLNDIKPATALEIGVYRGQTLAYWSQWARQFEKKLTCVGVSPFSNLGDSVSDYPNLDYLQDIHFSFDELGIPMFKPVKALSTEIGLSDKLVTEFGKFDLVYIDGGHDAEVVRSDTELAFAVMRSGGYMVMDDAGLFMPGKLPKGAFVGHRGPSEVSQEILASEKWFYAGRVGHNLVFRKL